jgi:predicted 3-demethylubiquinone-9 3-methyltransferase (glyoxalase superfamily)
VPAKRENGRHHFVIKNEQGEAFMQKVTPFLWFDNNAEEAMKFYTSVFKNSKIGKVTRYPEGSPAPAGSVMTGTFEIEGQEFIVLNGGPMFKFNESISFVVNCETQDEVDHYWNKLTADGGQEVQCGWLKDKFGLSWQIVPTILPKLLGDPDRAKGKRVMQAMLKMKKIHIEGLQRASAKE